MCKIHCSLKVCLTFEIHVNVHSIQTTLCVRGHDETCVRSHMYTYVTTACHIGHTGLQAM